MPPTIRESADQTLTIEHSHAGRSSPMEHIRPAPRPSATTTRRSQFQLVGDFRGDVLETYRRTGYAFESDAVDRQPRQLADLHLPLDDRVHRCSWTAAVNAQQQESFALLVVAVVDVEYTPDLGYHLVRIHGASRLHTPREAQRTRLRRTR
jgi:hypothetical protein